MDAFNAAVTIPDVLFSLMAGGALASAFIPIFTGFIAKEERDEAWKLASAVINLVALALTVASALAALFAPQIVRHVLVPLTNPDPDRRSGMTVDILRIILIAPAIFGVSGLIMGILNAHQNFLLPALAPVFNWVGWIIGSAFFWCPHGHLRAGLGLRAGRRSCTWLVQLPGLLRLAGRRYYPALGLDNPAVREGGCA